MCFRVNNFFCCLTLRTGGLVIGWMTLILNLISTTLCAIGLVAAIIFTCQEFIEISKEQGHEVPEKFNKHCDLFEGVFLVSAIIGLILCLILVLFGYLCISGTLNRQPGKIKPVMCVLAIEIIFTVIGVIFARSVEAAIAGAPYIILYGYLFACLYSLISKIQEENNRGYIYATSA